MTLARARSLACLVAFAIGIILADLVTLSSLVMFVVACMSVVLAAGAAVFAVASKPSSASALGLYYASIALAFAATGAGLFTRAVHEPVHNGLDTFITINAPGRSGPGRDSEIITLRGTILSEPKAALRDRSGLARYVINAPSMRFELSTRQLLMDGGSWHAAAGNLWVTVSGGMQLDVKAGDTVQLTGRFSHLRRASNPGESQYEPAARDRGFVGRLTLSSSQLIQPVVLDESAFERVSRWWLTQRAKAQSRARGVIIAASGDSSQSQSFMLSLLLGEYDPENATVYQAFSRLGIVHILSISGFHLTVMAGVSLFLIRLTGDRGWYEPALVAILIVGYCCIVPTSSPVLRSAAFALAIILSHVVGRQYDPVCVLAWIACGLLAITPTDLYSPGFQLSLGLTGALFWTSRSFMNRLFFAQLRGTIRYRERRLSDQFAGFVKEAITANIMCWLLSLPLLVFRFGWISPFAILISLLITPLFVLLLWVGYVALVVGMIFPPLATPASLVLSVLATSATDLVVWIDQLPSAWLFVPRVSLVWTLVSTLSIMALIRWAGRIRVDPRKSYFSMAMVCLCSFWMLVEWSRSSQLERDVRFRVDMLDVADGTCLLIRTPSQSVLWDCGSLNAAGSRNLILSAARELGVHSIPDAVITHPDIDHFGSLLDLCEPLKIRRVFVPARFLQDAKENPDGASALAVASLTERDIQVVSVGEGDGVTFDDVRLAFLSPPQGNDTPLWSKDNDHSLVGLWTTADKSQVQLALTTGDIDSEAITHIMSSYPDLKPSIVEAPHHGAFKEQAAAWLEDLEPAIVLQSTGMRRINHPGWALSREKSRWLVTAIDGACSVEIDRAGNTRVKTFHQID